MITLKVEINSKDKINYPIIIGEDAGVEIAKYCKQFSCAKVLIVTNETIYEIYQEKMPKIFADCGLQVEYCIVPDGEKYKNQEILDKILTCAFEAKLERNDLFAAFGGGVIGDITGFAAAIYMRGVNFMQIPTTILAQVDSSVGGKVAINTPYGKNLLGAFYQPKVVISDLNFLKTLPEREILTGLSEVIKYSFIEKTCAVDFHDFAKFLFENNEAVLKRNLSVLSNVVNRCCELKAAVVKQDEKENGLRSILNFGHTIGHAIEKCTQYNIFTHGEAVSIGMRGAFCISYKLKKINDEYFNFANNILSSYGFNFKIPENISPDKIFEALSYDKKVKDGNIRFVLPVGYADVEIFDNIASDIIMESIKELY